jgi:hypothetical protein
MPARVAYSAQNAGVCWRLRACCRAVYVCSSGRRISTLVAVWVRVGHEANTLGTPGEETGPEALAGRAGQGYAPNLDWFAQQDRGPVWPANQCESRCDQTVQLLWMRRQVSGITGPTTSTQ